MFKHGLKLWKFYTVLLKCLFKTGNPIKSRKGTYTWCTKYSKKFVIFYSGFFWQEQMELFPFFMPFDPFCTSCHQANNFAVPAVQLLALLSFFYLGYCSSSILWKLLKWWVCPELSFIGGKSTSHAREFQHLRRELKSLADCQHAQPTVGNQGSSKNTTFYAQ